MSSLARWPRRTALLACWLALTGTTIWGQESSPIGQQQIRVDVNLATLRFTVRDSGGNLLNGLRQEDFQIFEDGTAQEITFFEGPRNTSGRAGALSLAFLLDISGSTFATRGEEIASAQIFLDNVHSFTQVGVFGFTDRLVTFQEFTSTRNVARAALEQAQEHLGPTALYQSLLGLLARFQQVNPSHRKVVIVISDGMDSAYSRAAEVIARARKNNIAIYTILVPSAAQLYIRPEPRGDSGSGQREDDQRERKERAFATLSVQTAGKHFSGFEAILDFDDVMAQINDDVFGNLYTIGYQTAYPFRSRAERSIRVEIGHPGAHIPARFENWPDPLTAKKDLIAALFDSEAMGRLPQNLRGRFREIAADMDILPPEREGSQVGIPFRIKISPRRLRGSETGRVRTQLGVIALLLDPDGNEVLRLREVFRVNLDARSVREGRGIIYTNKLLVPPGVYALKLALLEISTWKLASFDRNVTALH